MRLHKLSWSQRGDTIVEVMISIAIVSMVLVGAYVSVAKSSDTNQNTTEHSQALELAQKQVEYLRAKGSVTTGSCFDTLGNVQPKASAACNLSINGGAAVYAQDIEQAATPGTYDISVKWTSINGTAANDSKVEVYYRP